MKVIPEFVKQKRKEIIQKRNSPNDGHNYGFLSPKNKQSLPAIKSPFNNGKKSLDVKPTWSQVTED